MQKINDLIESINIERKDEIGSNEYINYARENIEPIFLVGAIKDEENHSKMIQYLPHMKKKHNERSKTRIKLKK